MSILRFGRCRRVLVSVAAARQQVRRPVLCDYELSRRIGGSQRFLRLMDVVIVAIEMFVPFDDR